jgi:hypothetical protein
MSLSRAIALQHRKSVSASGLALGWLDRHAPAEVQHFVPKPKAALSDAPYSSWIRLQAATRHSSCNVMSSTS